MLGTRPLEINPLGWEVEVGKDVVADLIMPDSRTLQAVVAVVVESVDVVKMLEQHPEGHSMDGSKDTGPVLVVVVFVHWGLLR